MNAPKLRLLGHILRNLQLFREAQEIGFDYIANPESGELHKVSGGKFYGSHNLALGNLGDFIGLSNVGSLPIDAFRDGTVIPIYDLVTGELLGEYVLNKCKYCFPDL